MSRQMIRYTLLSTALLLGAWLLMGYLLPIGLPFLLGMGLALAAAPAAEYLRGRWKLPGGLACGVAVSAVFLLTLTVLSFLLGLVARQLQRFSGLLPQLEETLGQAAVVFEQFLTELAGRLPGSLGLWTANLTQTFFSQGGSVLEQLAMQIPKAATGLLGGLSQGAFGLITGIVSAYMICNRLPTLKLWWQNHQPPRWQEVWAPALKGLKKALGGWLLAQLKLAGVAFFVMAVGFLLLRIDNGLLWAGVITLVDAFPILGVGTVLVPWALVCFLQRNAVRAVGLLAIYGVVWLSRSILEPKLVGKGLGLDPLLTLMALYAGWKLWGIAGLLLAPILTMAIAQIVKQLKV